MFIIIVEARPIRGKTREIFHVLLFFKFFISFNIFNLWFLLIQFNKEYLLKKKVYKTEKTTNY